MSAGEPRADAVAIAPKQVSPRQSSTRILWLGAAMTVAGMGMASLAAMWSALSGLGLGILLLGGVMIRMNRGAEVLRPVEQLLRAGQWAEADALLEKNEARGSPSFRRMMLSNRAHNAFARGDVGAALAHAARGLSVRGGLDRRYGRQVRTDLLSLMALANAASGKLDEARRNLADARIDGDDATVPTRAKLVFAEALVEEGAGNRAEARRILTDRRRLLMHLQARVRGLLRVVRLSLDSSGAGAYRAPPSEEARGESELGQWIAQVAPRFAGLTRGAAIPNGEVTALPAARAAALGAPETSPAPSPRKNQSARTLGLWVALILMFILIWRFLGDPGGARAAPPPPPVDAGFLSYLVPALLGFALMSGLFGWMFWRSWRRLQRVEAARLATIEGDASTLSALRLAAPVQGENAAASAAAAEVEWYENRGELLRGLEACERAPQPSPGANQTIHAPSLQLLAARARLLMALGREEEALSALEAITDHHAFFDATRFSVHRLWLVRRRDWMSAARLAQSIPLSVNLPAREELLTDAVRSFATGESLAPVRVESAFEPEQLAWLTNAAPAVAAAVTAVTAEKEEYREALAEAEMETDSQPLVARAKDA